MGDINIVVVDSGSVYIEKLNHRLHHELPCQFHYHEVLQMGNGYQRSVHLFREIENPQLLPIMLRSYESLEGTKLYFGKVQSIRKYFIHGNNGPEGRLKIEADNKQLYDLPIAALASMGM